MALSTTLFVALVGLLALNRLALVLAGENRWWPVFWTVQFLDLGVAIYLAGWGLPNLPRELGMVNAFLALVFVLHVVENNRRRSRYLQEAGQRRLRRDEERRRAMLERLEATERGSLTREHGTGTMEEDGPTPPADAGA